MAMQTWATVITSSNGYAACPELMVLGFEFGLVLFFITNWRQFDFTYFLHILWTKFNPD